MLNQQSRLKSQTPHPHTHITHSTHTFNLYTHTPLHRHINTPTPSTPSTPQHPPTPTPPHPHTAPPPHRLTHTPPHPHMSRLTHTPFHPHIAPPPHSHNPIPPHSRTPQPYTSTPLHPHTQVSLSHLLITFRCSCFSHDDLSGLQYFFKVTTDNPRSHKQVLNSRTIKITNCVNSTIQNYFLTLRKSRFILYNSEEYTLSES